MAIREIIRNGTIKWQVDVTSRKLGRRVRQSFSDKVAAQKYESDVLYALSNGLAEPKPQELTGHVSSSKGHSLSQAFDDCFEQEWKHTASAEKMNDMKDHLFSYFGKGESVSNITTPRINAWIRDLRAGNWILTRGNKQEKMKPCSGSTINRKLACLSKVLKFAQMEGKLNSLPILKRQKEGSHVIRFVNQEEEIAILKYLKTWAHEDNMHKHLMDAYIISVETGLRAGELLNIQRKHISKYGLMIKETKNDNPRNVPLSNRARRILEIRSQTIDGDLLFPYQENWYRRS